MTTKRREERIKELREEGHEAYLSGKNLQQNPYFGTTDMIHWARGHEDAEQEASEADAASTATELQQSSDDLRLQLLTAITEFTSAPTRIAHMRLGRLLKEWEDFIVYRANKENPHGH